MTTITRWVLAHKRSVAAFWILVTLVGIATVSQATRAFSTEFTVPGREGFETNVAIARLYHQGGRNAPILPVVTLPAGTTVNSRGVRAGLDRVAAELGYTIITMWSASIGDSRPENETSLIANAAESFQPEQIVVAHANLPTITRCYPQLLDLIHSRGLQTVTLHDVFG